MDCCVVFCVVFSPGAVLVGRAQPGAEKGAEVRSFSSALAKVKSEQRLNNLSFSSCWIGSWPYVEFPVKLPGFLLCTGVSGQERALQSLQ